MEKRGGEDTTAAAADAEAAAAAAAACAARADATAAAAFSVSACAITELLRDRPVDFFAPPLPPPLPPPPPAAAAGLTLTRRITLGRRPDPLPAVRGGEGEVDSAPVPPALPGEGTRREAEAAGGDEVGAAAEADSSGEIASSARRASVDCVPPLARPFAVAVD